MCRLNSRADNEGCGVVALGFEPIVGGVELDKYSLFGIDGGIE